MFLSKNWYFSVQKALIYYTVNKSHYNSFILLVFSHVANFRYVANFRFLTLISSDLGFVSNISSFPSIICGDKQALKDLDLNPFFFQRI